MAKLRTFKHIENSIYVLNFVHDIEALSNSDKDLMRKFGEPEINLGGTFLGSTANEFTLPDEYVKIRSGFPVRKEFDSRSEPFDTNTVTKVNAYKNEIQTRFLDAFTDLRANSDTFTSEEIDNV
jgi:hypothetical protein